MRKKRERTDLRKERTLREGLGGQGQIERKRNEVKREERGREKS